MNSNHSHTVARFTLAPGHTTLPIGLTTIFIWLRRSRTRGQLRDLDARELLDIGRSESQRQRECARWFWQGSDRVA